MDRLAELRRVSGAGNVGAPDLTPEPQPAKGGGLFSKKSPAPPAPAVVDLEAGHGAAPAPKEGFLEGFFKDVEAVKEDIQAIRDAIRQMEGIQADSLVAQNSKEVELSQALNAVIHETNPRAARAKAILESMREDTVKMAGGKGNPSEYRIKQNLSSTLTRKFGTYLGCMHT